MYNSFNLKVMADEKIIVDIEVDSKEIKVAEGRVDSLTESIEELGNQIKDARKQNTDYKKQQKELNELYKQGAISTEKYEKDVDQLNIKIKANNKFIAESSIALSKQKQERAANIKLVNSETGSLAKLEAKATLLNKAITKQTKATKEGRQEYDKLEKELKDVNEEINAQRKAFADTTRNIGNYPELLNGISGGLEDVGGSAAEATGGLKVLAKGFKALLANPVVAVIAAIVAGLSALFSAFKDSESGSRLLNRGMIKVNGYFSIFTKKANEAGEAMSGAFDEGVEGSFSFWEALKQNVIRRLEGVMEIFKAVGDGLKALWDGNAEDMEKAAIKAKDALIQIGTGLNKEEFDAVNKKIGEFVDESEALSDAMLKLEAAQFKQRAASRFLQKDVAKLQAEFDKLTESAGDDTQAMNLQREAAIKAGEVAAKLAAQQQKLAGSRVSILRQELAVAKQGGKQRQDILDNLAAAEVEYTDAKSRAAIAQQKISIEQRKIERDIFEQNLDILLDVGDKIKTAQEKAIENEELSLGKRKMLLDASKAALTANFDAIKKEYELYGVTAEQINEVISASDAKQTNEKLKALGLNEIANNRLREIILEKRQAELDFNDLSSELAKEEVSRKEKANATIQQINEDAALKEITNAEDLRDKLIELERAKAETLLSDERLLEEEKAAIIAESNANIDEINEEYEEDRLEKRNEKWEEEQEFIAERLEEINEIVREFAGEEAAIFGKLGSGLADVFDTMSEDFGSNMEKMQAMAQVTGSALSGISNSVFAGQKERRDEDLADNELARTKELELAEGNEMAQEQINLFYDQKAKELKKKQFRADKAAALIDIGIATAVAVTKALPNIPLSIGVGILGGVQAGIVAAKKAPKFGGGTSDIVSIGDSHASGNDVDVWGYSGNSKQYFGKVEKGEAMPVIRKSAVSDYLVAKLNGQFSPRSRGVFEEGTPDITQEQSSVQNNEMFTAQLVAAMSNVQIVAKIEDITKESRKKIEIVGNSKV